jgi:UDP-N-acetylmuramate dehydrogenase
MGEIGVNFIYIKMKTKLTKKQLENFLIQNNFTFIKKPQFKNLTTIGSGGTANFLITINNITELKTIISICDNLLIIGGGSNIITSNKHHNLTLIKLSPVFQNEILHVEHFENRTLLEVSAGMPLSKLLHFAADNNLFGLNFLAGIPGTVGGAICGNAGAKFTDTSGEIGDKLISVQTINIKTSEEKTFLKEDCQFSYRHSIFKENKNLIILSATFQLEKSNEDIKKDLIEKIKRRGEKWKNFNLQGRTAGSVFKNVELNATNKNLLKNKIKFNEDAKFVSAGKIIDDLGLKGLTVGNARVSLNHGNIIELLNNDVKTNKNNDIIKLIKLIQKIVLDEFGLLLETEVRIID